MRKVTWNDNIALVGWTSVHGNFTVEDLEWLTAMHPNGHLTPTFYWRGKDVPRVHGKRDNMSWKQYLFIRPGEHYGFYFTFPEDEKGVALLTALRLQGMQGRGLRR